MLNKFIFAPLLLFTLLGITYPTKKENIELFKYCYSLEKIISRNAIQKRGNVSGNLKSISQDISIIGINKTKGTLINEIVDQYKNKKNSFIVNIFPNQAYCFAGYWIEILKPGTFEAVLYQKSKKTINEFKDFKDEVDGFLNDINSEYKSIKEELNKFF